MLRLTVTLCALLCVVFGASARSQTTSTYSNGALFFFPYQSVDAPDATGAWTGWSDFTIEFWFTYVDAMSSGGQPIIDATDTSTGNTAWSMSLMSTQDDVNFTGQTRLRFAFVHANPQLYANYDVFNLPWEDRRWHHFAVTRAGSVLTMYFDGAVCATFADAALMTSLGVGGHLRLGGPSGVTPCNSSCGNFSGLLNDVRLWNVARSSFDIATSMHVALAGAETGLVGYFPLDEGAGQTTADLSPTGAVGRLGFSTGPDIEDPNWITTTAVPFRGWANPAAPYGQANSAAASLRIAQSSALSVPGPWIAQIGETSDSWTLPYTPGPYTVTFIWSGPANAAFVLAAGNLNVGAAVVPGLGSIDIGTPPTFGDVTIVMDGIGLTLGQPEQMNPAGTLVQTFTVTMPPGVAFDFQGFVAQPIGASVFGVLPTAAVRLRFN